MEEQMLQATIQSILGLLPLHSSPSAQGSSASTLSRESCSWLLWQTQTLGKWHKEETLLRKCQAWRCSSTACQEKQGKAISSHPTSLTSDPPAGKSVCACICVHTVAGKEFRTFNCTLDLIQHTQHQATTLLELPLYRAGESEAQLSPFSLRSSRAGGHSLQLAARLGAGCQVPTGSPGQTGTQLSLRGCPWPCKAWRALWSSKITPRKDSNRADFSYFYMVSYHRRIHSRLLSN